MKHHTETQKEMMLADMMVGVRINPLEAIRRYGCTKAATRIGELIRDGFKIEKEPITVKTRRGKTRVMSYYMKP